MEAIGLVDLAEPEKSADLGIVLESIGEEFAMVVPPPASPLSRESFPFEFEIQCARVFGKFEGDDFARCQPKFAGFEYCLGDPLLDHDQLTLIPRLRAPRSASARVL